MLYNKLSSFSTNAAGQCYQLNMTAVLLQCTQTGMWEFASNTLGSEDIDRAEETADRTSKLTGRVQVDPREITHLEISQVYSETWESHEGKSTWRHVFLVDHDPRNLKSVLVC
jgi:hypothetical protein